MTKPQTLAEQPVEWRSIDTAPRGGEWFFARTIRGTIRYVHFADKFDRFPISHDGVIWETDPIEWTIEQPVFSAIADAAATTTPAEQAGDVRQAVRVKLFIDDDGDICHDPRGADMNLVAMASIDDDGRVMHPDLFKAMVDAYNAAIEPDPTPALGWKAMQTAAASALADLPVFSEKRSDAENGTAVMVISKAQTAILALPGPTDAQLSDEAVRLLSRDALMVENIDAVADACREFKIKPELFRAALAALTAWRDAQ